MLSNQEDLPTAGKYHYYVRIAESCGQHSHVFFDPKDLIESFGRDELIHKNDLSAILDHAVTGIARERKDSLLWVIFEQFA